ncbi:MAG: hypothetical protein WAK93_00815 [Solirubrobacteraceae bacterium]
MPLLERSAAFVRSLPDHSLLDRIVRGRAWIPLIGVLLAGIVAMQVEVLKLNAGIGRSLARGTALQSQNALLRAQVATLADDGRIEAKAARMGMVMPSPASIKFLSLGKNAAVARAVTNVHEPDATAFTSALTASGIGVSSSDGASTTSATSDTMSTPAAPVSSDTISATPTASTSSGTTPTGSGSSDVATPGSSAAPATPVAVPTDSSSSSSTGSTTP